MTTEWSMWGQLEEINLKHSLSIQRGFKTMLIPCENTLVLSW